MKDFISGLGKGAGIAIGLVITFILICFCCFPVSKTKQEEIKITQNTTTKQPILDIDTTNKKQNEEKEDNKQLQEDSSTNEKNNITDNTNELNSLTLGQKNALKQAQTYLKFMTFSYTGLIEQLEFEGYSNEEATFAANNCGANWKEQAAKQAQTYLDFMAFSKEGLLEQLIYEGFTEEEALYGIEAIGY